MEQNKLRDLLASLTLEEKVGQLVQLNVNFYDVEGDSVVTGSQIGLGISEDYNLYNTGSLLNVFPAESIYRIQKQHMENSRHKIPLLFCADIIHGFETVFPTPLAQAASFDMEVVEGIANALAVESVANGVHCTFAPMLDMVKDPRWGRVVESPGESTTLAAEYARAAVRGFQGVGQEGPIPANKIASCVKHFAAYGAAEGGRDYNTVDMSKRRFYEEYLPGYKAGLEEGARMVMTSFNVLDGVPASGNKWLNRQVLRDEIGTDAVLISDYAAIYELINHGVAANEKEAAYLAIHAGVDIDMMTSCYANNLADLVREGRVDEALVDEAVWRILKLKNDLGLFEDPYRGLDIEKEKDFYDEHYDIALDAAAKTTILLKNEDVLPLSSDKKVALIGAYGESKDFGSNWIVTRARKNTTILNILEEKLGVENVDFARGYELPQPLDNTPSMHNYIDNRIVNPDDAEALHNEAVELAKSSDVIVLTLGQSKLETGEGASKADMNLNDAQIQLVKSLRELGKPIVAVIFSGRPVVLTNIDDDLDSILYSFMPGAGGAEAIVDILYGETNPSARVPMSFPRSVGQIPVYHSRLSTGRPTTNETVHAKFFTNYLDEEIYPLYAFGQGESYSKLIYSDLTVDDSQFASEDKVLVSVEVQNDSEQAVREVVQLYIRDHVAQVARPVTEIKAFSILELDAGASEKVTLELTREDLSYFDQDAKLRFDSGEFTLSIRRNAEEVILSELVNLA